MIAKIADDNKREYYSTVFALCNNGWHTAVIVFDDEKQRFAYVPMYPRNSSYPARRVFLIDCSHQDFLLNQSVRISPFRTLHNVEGYPWLLSDTKLFSDILNGKDVDSHYKEMAANLNASIHISEWTLVQRKQDIESLKCTAWDFHDGVIESYRYNAGTDCLEVVFTGCWGSKITLRFQADPKVHIHLSDPNDSYVADSSIFFDNGYVYWTDDYSIESEESLLSTTDVNYFAARALYWKQETEWKQQDS